MTIVAYDGKVHVCAAMCPTCIFRPGNLMDLEDGRVEQMVRDCGEDGQIPCHETTDKRRGAVCRGFYDKHRNQALQVLTRLGHVNTKWRKK